MANWKISIETILEKRKIKVRKNEDENCQLYHKNFSPF